MQKITYEDKEDLIIRDDVNEKNKVSASDMNEIKEVVNNQSDSINTLLGRSGYIVDSGSTDNSSYIKYDNGLMIVIQRLNCTGLAVTNTWGSAMYYGLFDVPNFPQRFVRVPTVSYTCDGAATMIPCNGATTSTYGVTRVVIACAQQLEISNSHNVHLNIMAIGYWK